MAAGGHVEIADRAHVRLAELVASLSLGIDLGFGQPMEHVLRQCLIALRLAERIGLDENDRAAVYYTALLVNVGCHTDAHEQAKWFGDDIALKATKYDHAPGSAGGAIAGLRLLGSGQPLVHRLRVVTVFAVSGHRAVADMISRHAEMTREFAAQLGLPAQVLDGLGAAYEQWDGHGWPGGLDGPAVPIAARLAQIAEYVEVAHRAGGAAAAAELATERAGRSFDPELAAIVADEAELLLSGLDDVGTWDAVIAAEPALVPVLSGERFEAALATVADFVDLKSPYTAGHARALASLAGEAAGDSGEASTTLRRAGLLAGLGRLGISNAIWDKPGPLGAGEWERVRLHPYLTDRILHQSASLAPFGAIVLQHRERLDGSGYPRGLAGSAISFPARILGAADAYQAMREPRPHRPALGDEQAAAELRSEVRAGRLDADAVEAVLGAAGHRATRRRQGPAGLTAREIDVLRLVARGQSNREVAAQLVISPKTVANHVEHIYAKIGVSTRAAACLFAVQNGLLPER